MPNLHSTSISLIVPALNEELIVGKVLSEILQQVESHFACYELIALNDGSTDATGQIMDSIAFDNPHVKVVHNANNMGLGASFQAGLAIASGDYVMLLCGDGGLPARSLPAIFDKVGSADLVIPHMVNLRKIKTPLRFLLSRIYTKLLNYISGSQLNYYNGLPVYRRVQLANIKITSRGFGFQGEIIVKLLKSGASHVEVGVEGAEETGRSFALKPRNIFSVARTFASLTLELLRFKAAETSILSSGISKKNESK